jgi:hypothetical protein
LQHVPRIIGALLGVGLAFGMQASSAGGRLLATGGAMPVEGAAGGGIVPWAVLSGYSTPDDTGPTVAYTRVESDDYELDVVGVSWNLWNRVELSAARQTFDIGVLTPALGFDPGDLEQDVFGLKVRLLGDVVYTPWPQVAVGAQYKHNGEFLIPSVIGAVDDEDTDFYVAATKLFLAGAFGRNLALNGTVRWTRANQVGLAGFGGDLNDDRELMAELSAAVFLNRKLAVSVEYRQKPDNLGFAEEDDWSDAFVAWFPNKHVAVVGAWAELGSIATLDSQNGFYLSVQASY